jgi:hypothetical protein
MQQDILANNKAPIDRGIWEPSLHLHVVKLILVDLLRNDKAWGITGGHRQWFWHPC